MGYDESPVVYAQNLWNEFLSGSSRNERNSKGQFCTPPAIARYMASMVPLNTKSIRLLEPGAGTGILTAAVGEIAVEVGSIKEIIVDLYENDEELNYHLQISLEYLRKWLDRRGISLISDLKTTDFVLENANIFKGIQTLTGKSYTSYDSVIMNPPYFKIKKSDIRARVASNIVHGQPNIYSIFLFLGALLLKKTGTLVSITPRSFTSGAYFQEFRKHFFEMMHPKLIHLFSSRTRAFKDAAILQETVIMKSLKSKTCDETTIGSCVGVADLQECTYLTLKTKEILRESDGQVLFIPTSIKEVNIMKEIERWPETFSSLELKISTGPVVPFRATEFIQDYPTTSDYVPLLWMRNVHHKNIEWPLPKIHSQYILDTKKSRPLLRPVSPYVLLHRFSAKEQERRLITAYFDPKHFNFKRIGFENHLNYIHRPKGKLDETECIGLVSLLGTKLLDTYIRIRSGNTQINASDMNSIPLPTLSMIKKIGEVVTQLKYKDDTEFESIVINELENV